MLLTIRRYGVLSQDMQSEEEARLYEQKVEAKVSAWMQSRTDTSSLLNEIANGITTKSFNSAALMRMRAEVLLLSGNRSEGIAAFDTYVSLQKLSLFKARSGTTSFPDTLEGTVRVFTALLSIFEYEGTDSLPRMAELGDQLLSIVEEMATTFQQVLIAPVMARVSLARMIMAEGNEAYSEATSSAHRWFGQMNQEECDAESCFAYALFLSLVDSPKTAFPAVKLSLAKKPDHLRSALLLVQLLTTNEEQLGAALELANAYLSQRLVPTSVIGKLTLLQLKKTQIALLEKIYGRDSALKELEAFIELASTIYAAPNSNTPEHKANGVQNGTKRRLFGLRRETSRQVSASESRSSHPTSKKQEPQLELAYCWLWISLQYAKFGLDTEALEAMDEASELWPSAQSIKEYAHAEALLGHIHRKRDPKRALSHYHQALVTHALQISSAVGAARIVCENIDDNYDFALTLLGFLDAICVRSPGRFLPEVWYARGLLHESLKGAETARPLFWKAVELEERRAVTSYLLLNAAV